MTFTVINASAGSGKTHTLTHQIADRVRGGLSPSQLIATTFTTKAADELTDRVRRTLLEEGLVAAAQGVDSALIGTVNAVAGQLVAEFALDAGISPEVRVLDEDGQKAAFSAAIDEAATRRAEQASGLLARTEHDGEENPSFAFGQKPSWRRSVRDAAAAARTNLISADALRAAAADSWAEYRAAGLPETGADQRADWARRLGMAIADVRAELAAGTVPARSINKVETSILELEELRTTLARTERAPWSGWLKLARVASAKVATGTGQHLYGASVDPHLLGLATEVADSLLENPVLQADLQGLITLVLETAADSLDAYEAHKAHLGLIDFADQEVMALRLLQTSDRARYAVSTRFRLLAVDEFQDTSPVQLALFLQLSTLIEDKIWVGDPKQAVYGFRDADPALMLGIIEQIEAGTTLLGPGEVQNLDRSWRSQAQVLALPNAIFPRIFPALPPERVLLSPAEQAEAARTESGALPGRIEAWIPQSEKKSVTKAAHALSIADGVVGLLAEPGVSPADIAVLVRTNADAAAVVAALNARGVPATGEGVPIRSTREGRILRAGLAVALDRSDTLALTELVQLLPEHAAHTGWFGELMAAPDRDARRAVFERWWQDPQLASLRDLRERCTALTPAEMVTELIEALDLPERLRAWTGPEQRLRTLDAVRSLAATYAEQSRADGAPVTLAGLRSALDATDAGPDLSGMPGAVWVGTIHGAKGLEWPQVVVMLETTAKEHLQTSGVFVVPSPELDVTDPLAGRALRYWPDVLSGSSPLHDALSQTEHAGRRLRAEREEAGRLQYVAFTRARDVTALSGPGTAPVFDALVETEPPFLSWEARSDGISLAGGESIPARVRLTSGVLPVDEDGDAAARPAAARALAASDLLARSAASAPASAHLAATFRASAALSEGVELEVAQPRRIGPALVSGGGRDWNRVGDAVHAYLALPLASLTPAQRERAAQRLLQRWMVERAVGGTDVLIAAGEAWLGFLETEMPGAEVLTEQPIAWWNEDEQAMQGWIDALLRLPGGEHVLVDHKTYPGADPVAHVRKEYLGQMETYSRALAAAGLPLRTMLIHLPLRGEVLEIRPHQGLGA